MPRSLWAESTGGWSSLFFSLFHLSSVLLFLSRIGFQPLTSNKLGEKHDLFLALGTFLCLVFHGNFSAKKPAGFAEAKAGSSNSICTRLTRSLSCFIELYMQRHFVSLSSQLDKWILLKTLIKLVLHRRSRLRPETSLIWSPRRRDGPR